MFIVVAALSIAGWVLGMVSHHVWDGKIHLMLALAFTSIVLHIVQRKSRARILPAVCNPSDQRRDARLLHRDKQDINSRVL
jgi:hypothetical protein